MAETYVYMNLTKKCWSLMASGKVYEHRDVVLIDGARFVVREGGRQRVLREKRKSVHAFVVGEVREETVAPNEELIEVRYNPYEDGFFKRVDTGERVLCAGSVLMEHGKVFAINPLTFSDVSVSRVE